MKANDLVVTLSARSGRNRNEGGSGGGRAEEGRAKDPANGGNKAFREGLWEGGRRGIIFVSSAAVFRGDNAPLGTAIQGATDPENTLGITVPR